MSWNDGGRVTRCDKRDPANMPTHEEVQRREPRNDNPTQRETRELARMSERGEIVSEGDGREQAVRTGHLVHSWQDPSIIVRILNITPIKFKITKPGKYRIVTRYFATDSAPIQLEDKIEICSSGVEIDYDCFGVLAAGAEKSLKFTLDFKTGATNSTGNEREEVLLLGKPKRNLSSPNILCAEPTISGSHGVTLGEMPERELDYLRSRGLSEKAAKELIIRSRFAEAFKLAKLEQNWDNSLEEQFEEMLKETLR